MTDALHFQMDWLHGLIHYSDVYEIGEEAVRLVGIRVQLSTKSVIIQNLQKALHLPESVFRTD